jgi:hypothetical protein
MSVWRSAIGCLCALAVRSTSAQDFTFSVELDGVLGIVEKKDANGNLDSLVVLVPQTKSPIDAGIPAKQTSKFTLNGLPWHVPVIEVDNRNLFGPSAYGKLVVPLLESFTEVRSSCRESIPPHWDGGNKSSVDMLPAVRRAHAVMERAVVDPDVMTGTPVALAVRWVFRCGETITLRDSVDNTGRPLFGAPGKLEKHGKWQVEPVTGETLNLKVVTLTRTVPAGTTIQLGVGTGSPMTLMDDGHGVKLKLRNVPPDQLITGIHPPLPEDSTFAHFRWLYGLARKEDKQKATYFVLAPVRPPSGDPFCTGQGTLLENPSK